MSLPVTSVCDACGYRDHNPSGTYALPLRCGACGGEHRWCPFCFWEASPTRPPGTDRGRNLRIPEGAETPCCAGAFRTARAVMGAP